MIEIFPTAVPKDAQELLERANFIRNFSTNIHIDADDGIFTPVVCWPYRTKGEFVSFDLTAVKGLKTEVHLMVQDSREIGRHFARAGAYAVFGHVETFKDVQDAKTTLDSWKVEGAQQSGMAILLDTSLDIFETYAPLCDFFCFMASAQIGAQGATFDTRVIERIQAAHRRFPDLQLEVDIGVSQNTITDLARAGATRFSVGSAIAKSPDPAQTHKELLELASAAV